MEGDMFWEDYDEVMEDYLPTLEDLQAMGLDPEDLQDLPDEDLYQLLQEYMMGEYEADYRAGMEAPLDDEFSLTQHIQECSWPVARQGLDMMVPLLLLCGSLRVSALLDIPMSLLHIVCAASGLFLLWNTFGVLTAYIVGVSLLSYILLLWLSYKGLKHKGPITGVACIATLILWELCLADPRDWHRIRGAQMILVMKVISLGFDLDHGVVPAMIGLQEYLGYTFCVGTVLFGPWVSFNSYKSMLQPNPLSFMWILRVIVNFFLALVCLNVSVCIAPFLFVQYKSKWLSAYGDAASFRYSHYFVSYFSSASSVLAGYGAVSQSDGSVKWEFSVAKPWHIELPRSLVDVVTNWNIPMHYWLKNYVFKTSAHLGKFAAILLTYIASSVLHGLNFQLAAVLLSLGVYSYIEHVFRSKLADTFSACINARKCKNVCVHEYKAMNPLVILVNLLFSGLAIFHLAYLGVVFNTDSELQEEGYTMKHTLDTWSRLNYASHYVVLGTYLFNWLIQ
ncbi:protein-serine O-palmitoleoyltransferase porcupine-like [Diadema antillarum]|uniref:protein-serine O-palmitoleoyltransferase porcupine-like n=2 Tax=Diadema antillarum TaxID=105358 RepID=UPI003A866C74